VGAKEESIKEERIIKGLKIRKFSAVMTFVSVLICVFLIYATVSVSERHEMFLEQTESYIEWKDKSEMIREASDYLTEQVRLFTHERDPVYMHNYFEEINVTKRREQVMEALTEYYSKGAITLYLESAVEESQSLMKQEYYSMKLVCEAMDFPEEVIPEEIRAVALSQEDMELDPEAQVKKAHELLYNREYQASKTLIYGHITHFAQAALSNVENERISSEGELFASIDVQERLLVVLIILNFITFAVILLLISKPLGIYSRCIEQQKMLEPEGAYELRQLAHIYNEMYESRNASVAKEAQLRHLAEHDALTGIMNRGVFDEACIILEKSELPLALLLIDVDKFKEVNDEFGHDVGDRALKRVAAALTENFQSKDYLFRIGGDEFAAILIDFSEENAPVLEERINIINRYLQNSADEMPSFTLSVGAAFSKKGYYNGLFSEADRALYEIKRNGRGNICFYVSPGNKNQ